MFKEKATKLLSGLQEQIGKNWHEFIKKIRHAAEKDDRNVIQYEKLLKILQEFKVKFNEKERELFMQAFVANSDRVNVLVNISRLYSIRVAK